MKYLTGFQFSSINEFIFMFTSILFIMTEMMAKVDKRIIRSS